MCNWMLDFRNKFINVRGSRCDINLVFLQNVYLMSCKVVLAGGVDPDHTQQKRHLINPLPNSYLHIKGKTLLRMGANAFLLK